MSGLIKKIVYILMNTAKNILVKYVSQKKAGHLNLSVFNMIRETNESKTLTKHISCECKCKLDGTKCNPNQWWNNDKC